MIRSRDTSIALFSGSSAAALKKALRLLGVDLYETTASDKADLSAEDWELLLCISGMFTAVSVIIEQTLAKNPIKTKYYDTEELRRQLLWELNRNDKGNVLEPLRQMLWNAARIANPARQRYLYKHIMGLIVTEIDETSLLKCFVRDAEDKKKASSKHPKKKG